MSVENIKVVVKTLKEPICFIKRGREKQLTLSVTVIRLDNNFWIDTQVLIDNRYTRSCINQQFVINHKIPTKQMSFIIPVYNVDGTLNKNRSIKEFATLQLAINDHYKYIDLTVTELEDTNLFLGYNWLKIHNSSID